MAEENEQPIAVIIACMDRRLNELVDEEIWDLRTRGYEVKVFRTAGGNVNPIEGELMEIAKTGRLKTALGMPHYDCGWVKAAAQVCYFGGVASMNVVESMKEVFVSLEVSEKEKGDLTSLHLSMEEHNADYLNRALIDILGKEFDIRIKMPDAKLFDKEKKGEKHDHHLLFAGASDLTTSEMSKRIGVEPWEIYELRGRVDNLLIDAEVAVRFLGLNRHMVYVFGKEDDRRKLKEEGFGLANAEVKIVTPNGKPTKLKNGA